MKTVSLKLPDDLAARATALKASSGLSESAILRSAIQAGIGKVESAMDLIRNEVEDDAAAAGAA